MKYDFNWFKWYTWKVRLICHIVFWSFYMLILFLNYRRLISPELLGWFMLKDLFASTSLFYFASYIISHWIKKRKISIYVKAAIAGSYFIFGYAWWGIQTYFACKLAMAHSADHIENATFFFNYILTGGISSIFHWDKIIVMFLDFIFLITFPLMFKFMKSLMDEGTKNVLLENENLKIELNFRKIQVPPHFLMNSLNNIYILSLSNDPRTSQLIIQLSNLMKYTLYESMNEVILLSKELTFVKNYLVMTKLRYTEEVSITYHIPEVDEPYTIIPLVLIPIVENAFKHGPSQNQTNSWVSIDVQIVEDKLIMIVENSFNKISNKSPNGGLGIDNVKKRLSIHYPNHHCLEISPGKNRYMVKLTVDLKK